MPILPDLDRALATGGTIGGSTNDITFTFQGFSSADETAYRAYLAKAMPVARAVYGPPAFDIDVTVIQEKGLVAVQGGTYDVTTNEIRLPEIDPGNHNWPEDTFVLMLLVLNAFHDDVALLYDSWEQGMVGAAATVVQTSPRVSPSYNPYFPNPFYFGSVYEPMNQPALGNSTWYPASGAANMLYWRISEARSAWHKCYVEDAQFFQRFNTQYYAKLNPLSAADRAVLSGDTPALLELCQAVLPTVEGAPFVSWYRQQFVLDTSVTVGPKLYCCNTPLYDYIPLIVEHYMTDSTGDETPRGGTANLTYYNYDFSLTLYAQEGYTITLPSVSDPANGIYAGEGYLSPAFMNIGGAQRITVQMELNGLLGRYTYPYGVRDFLGDGTNLNDVYGAIIGPTEGTIDVVGLGGLTDVQVTKGIWSGVINNHMLDPAQLKVTFDDGNGNQVTRTINVAYDSYDVLLSAGSRSVLAKNLPYGTSGLYMISLPLWPVEPDAAQALGIPASDLLLARWKPGAPAGGGYEIYPTLDPMAPGRGYWLRILNDVTVAVDGVLPSGDSDVLVPLGAGWNMIGCARNSNIDLGELQVQRGTDSQPFADAVADGWVQGGLWAYGQLAGYSLVQKLKPFEGYWLRCLLPEGATLVFPSAAAAAARESAVAEEYSPYGDTTWKTTLLLEVADARSSATLGVAPGAGDGLDARCDLQAPPAFGDQPTLGFFDKAWGSQAGEYASDFRGASTRNPWQLRVSSVPEGVPARLRWPDLSELPRDVRPVLVDPARGREVSMRTAAGYEFTGTGAPAEMEIQLRRGSSGALAVMGLAGVPTRQGVEVTYVLSADAAVTATVLNVAGRPIRDLVQDKPQSAGRATLLWDLRASDGLPVPNGAYLVELAARSEDGQLARGLSRVSVFR